MNNFMQIALEEAQAAAERGEVPIGAVLTDSSGAVLARNGNRTLEHRDPTAHAEMLVIREACEKAGAQRIPDCDLYVTLEPCTMCAAAISFARIRRVIAGAIDRKGGALWHGAKFYDQPTCHHRPEIAHEPLEECGQILKSFFQARRQRPD
jgi:tRNA(Arg) A34 adenosine deaminase TadA